MDRADVVCKYCEDPQDNQRTGKFGCETGIPIDTDTMKFNLTIEHNGEQAYFVIDGQNDDDTLLINYCPMCGRKLGE